MIKGYDIPFGHMGYVQGKYMEFATDDEYTEYVEESEEENDD